MSELKDSKDSGEPVDKMEEAKLRLQEVLEAVGGHLKLGFVNVNQGPPVVLPQALMETFALQQQRLLEMDQRVILQGAMLSGVMSVLDDKTVLKVLEVTWKNVDDQIIELQAAAAEMKKVKPSRITDNFGKPFGGNNSPGQ